MSSEQQPDVDLGNGLSEIGSGLVEWTFGQPEVYSKIATDLRFIALHPTLQESELHWATSETLVQEAALWDDLAEAVPLAEAIFELNSNDPPETVDGAVKELDVAIAATRVLELFQRAGEAGRRYGHRFGEVHHAVGSHVEKETADPYEKPKGNTQSK